MREASTALVDRTEEESVHENGDENGDENGERGREKKSGSERAGDARDGNTR